MTTNLSGGDGWLPATGFGPGTIYGGALTLGGWVMRKVARR